MKRAAILSSVIAAVALAVSVTFGQEGENLWSSGTAHTLPQGRWEKGLFQPLRFGLSDTKELRLNPLISLLAPHIHLKVSRRPVGGWQRAYRYGIISPTPLLRMVQREGTGGFLAVDPDIGEVPWMVMIRQEVLLSRPWSRGLVTLKGGVAIALGGGDIDSRLQIELPVIYPRLALYHSGYQLNFGLDVSTLLSKRLVLLGDVDLFLAPALDGPAWEHKGVMQWNKSDRLQLSFGYKLTYTPFPWGAQWHLIPLFDLQIARQRGSQRL